MQSTGSTQSFIPRLEALRGLAAVSVVGYHAYAMRHETAVTGLAPVVLFFVLSGFVLAGSLDRDPAATRFFRNRVFRLLPAGATTVLLLTVLHWRFGFHVGFEASFDWTNVLLNALMVRSDINGVMWSMTVECAASPLILASFWIHKRYGPRPLIALCAFLIVISSWGPYVNLLGGFTNLAPMYAFVFGVLLHFAPKPQLSSSLHIVSTAAIVIVLAFCGLRKQTALTIFGEALASGALIYLIANVRDARLFGFLDAFIARLLGRISYSFYLLHPIGLWMADRSDAQSSWTLFALAVAYTVPMALLSWAIIERPFIAIGRLPPAVLQPATAA